MRNSYNSTSKRMVLVLKGPDWNRFGTTWSYLEQNETSKETLDFQRDVYIWGCNNLYKTQESQSLFFNKINFKHKYYSEAQNILKHMYTSHFLFSYCTHRAGRSFVYTAAHYPTKSRLRLPFIRLSLLPWCWTAPFRACCSFPVIIVFRTRRWLKDTINVFITYIYKYIYICVCGSLRIGGEFFVTLNLLRTVKTIQDYCVKA